LPFGLVLGDFLVPALAMKRIRDERVWRIEIQQLFSSTSTTTTGLVSVVAGPRIDIDRHVGGRRRWWWRMRSGQEERRGRSGTSGNPGTRTRRSGSRFQSGRRIPFSA